MEKNLCSWKNQKKKKVVGEKKKEKKQTLRRKKGYHSVKKRKNFLCDRDWYWGSSSLASRFQTKTLLSNQNLPYMMVIIVSSSSTLL